MVSMIHNVWTIFTIPVWKIEVVNMMIEHFILNYENSYFLEVKCNLWFGIRLSSKFPTRNITNKRKATYFIQSYYQTFLQVEINVSVIYLYLKMCNRGHFLQTSHAFEITLHEIYQKISYLSIFQSNFRRQVTKIIQFSEISIYIFFI